MTRKSAGLAALGSLAVACAQTHTVAVPVAKADLATLRSRLDGKESALAYVEPEALPAKRDAAPARRKVIAGTIYFDPFVVRVVDRGGQQQAIPYDQVSLIQRVDRAEGAGQGVAIGLGIGVLLGGTVGYLAGDDCAPQAILCFDRASAAGGLAVALGALGMLAGAVAGSSGAVNDWVFTPGPNLGARQTP